MPTRQEAITEVATYITNHIRHDVNAELVAAEIVDNDIDNGGHGHGEVRGLYTMNAVPLVVSFNPVDMESLWAL